MKFVKENFEISGQWVHYNVNGKNEFVARIRTGSKTPYINFLIKHFEVEEYFTMLKDSSPLEVLQTKGFISPNLRKALKSYGCPATQEGIQQMKEIMISQI